VRASCSRWR